jgi:1-acyl-sn-glycerol-3-phosphate acyltransferase
MPQYSIAYPRLTVRRTLMRLLSRGLLRLLTCTKVEGLENIPKDGPVILAGNHVAVLESVLMTVMPKRLVEPIGAGDMPFDAGIDSLVSFYGYIPINRGNLDRKGMNQALDVLKQGGVIGIFPEGGTWAPGKMAPQIGVALLSQRTGAPVVPIGFSGMQGALKNALHLKRPKLLMKVGEAIPAMKTSDDGVDKEHLLAYSRQVLDAIYALISQEEKDLMPLKELYQLSIETADEVIPNPDWGPAFAHFLHAPVLLDSLKGNLKLPIGVLYGEDEHLDTSALQAALISVQDYLKINPAFFTYRFGMEEGNQVADGIQGLKSLLENAEAAGKLVRLNTRGEISYIDGRVETTKKRFVIEPGR